MKKYLEKATFAAGCFWHIQDVFDKTPGVVSSLVGYIGGRGMPSYETTEEKGFAEAIEIIFDPQKISYNDLLDIFWREHDPTSLNRQGPDIGRRYRSAIFYHTEKQKKQSLKSKEEIQKKFDRPVVTEIVTAGNFFPAEKYHQKYFQGKALKC